MEQNKEKELPIGFMDSGLGGISTEGSSADHAK
jgi:glutamate racemase